VDVSKIVCEPPLLIPSVCLNDYPALLDCFFDCVGVRVAFLEPLLDDFIVDVLGDDDLLVLFPE